MNSGIVSQTLDLYSNLFMMIAGILFMATVISGIFYLRNRQKEN